MKNQMTLVKRTVSIHIKKLPTYKGFRVREYRPLVFSSSAICPSLVFLPEVFFRCKPNRIYANQKTKQPNINRY